MHGELWSVNISNVISNRCASRESGEKPEQARYCNSDETAYATAEQVGRRGSRVKKSQETGCSEQDTLEESGCLRAGIILLADNLFL